MEDDYKPTLGEIYRVVKEIRSEIKEIRHHDERTVERFAHHDERLNKNERDIAGMTAKLWAIVAGILLAIVGFILDFFFHR